MTIVEAIKTAMRAKGSPMTTEEVYQFIVSEKLYEFHADNPAGVVRQQIRRHCDGIEYSSASPTKHFKIANGGRYDILSSPIKKPRRVSTTRVRQRMPIAGAQKNAAEKIKARPVPKAVAKVSSTTPTAKSNGTKKTTATSVTPSKKQQAPKLRTILEGAGFKHIRSDGIHFTLQNQQGEIDHIFVWKNVILLCEETAGQEVSKHSPKKVFFHRIIAQHWAEFLKTYRVVNTEFDGYLGTQYRANELEVRHIYYSEEQDLHEGIASNADPVRILSREHAAYFSELVAAISKSAKYEILKYLNVSLSRVGENRISGSGVVTNSFSAFALPSTHTNYPDDFAVVSFYADPMALLQRAYIMRRDGWENADLSYQRFIRHEKLLEMRQHLSENGSVFINNVIVTLPSKALMKKDDGSIVDSKTLLERTHVELQLPLELSTVGIIDGQHRILAYYEGTGIIEDRIAQLRSRQNLLVTGIIFPKSYSTEMRTKFEAKLFLSINNTQTAVDTSLRQDLEILINPETPLAIARAVVNLLSRSGPLQGMLQISQSDSTDRIASGSLAPFALESLLRKGSAFYRTWDSEVKQDLEDPTKRQGYIDYANTEIQKFLVGCSHNLRNRWRPVAQGGVLSTTVIAGLIHSLGRLCEANTGGKTLDYVKILNPIADFDFSKYSSSAWARLSRDIMAALTFAPK